MVSECVIRERVAKNVKKKQQLCLEDMLVYYLPADTKLLRLSFCWNFSRALATEGESIKTKMKFTGSNTDLMFYNTAIC